MKEKCKTELKWEIVIDLIATNYLEKKISLLLNIEWQTTVHQAASICLNIFRY